MASRWEQFDDDEDHLLQYRTAGDSKVRPEHAELNGVTLPKSDSFWDEYYPPNGWNCRCTAVEVLKSKYPQTDHDEAMRRGQKALQKDSKKMFRWNPGKEQRSFPAYNPYTIRRCNGCDLSKLAAGKGPDPNNPLCEACVLLCRKLDESKVSEISMDPQRYDLGRSYKSSSGGGMVAVEKGRYEESLASKNETEKYEKEMRMNKVIADNGHEVIYRKESGKKPGDTFDDFINGIPADLKRISGGAGNIVKYADKCFKKQGAKIVVFEIPSADRRYFECFSEIKRKYELRVLFYVTGEEILKEVIR